MGVLVRDGRPVVEESDGGERRTGPSSDLLAATSVADLLQAKIDFVNALVGSVEGTGDVTSLAPNLVPTLGEAEASAVTDVLALANGIASLTPR